MPPLNKIAGLRFRQALHETLSLKIATKTGWLFEGQGVALFANGRAFRKGWSAVLRRKERFSGVA